MSDLIEKLRSATEREAVPDMLDALLSIAEVLIVEGNRARAFEVLALITQYPMPSIVRAQAEILYDDLESQLSAREIYDAIAQLDVTTLDDMVIELLGADA